MLLFHSIFLARYMEKHLNEENQDLELYPKDASKISMGQNT